MLAQVSYEKISGEQHPETRADVSGHIVAVRQHGGGKGQEKCRQKSPDAAHQLSTPEIYKKDGKEREQHRHDAGDRNDTAGIIPGFVEELLAHRPLAVYVLGPSGDVGWGIWT